MNVGLDEAGRGCVFGPVVASAVIWNDEITHKYLKDSKKLTENQRLFMYDFITDNAIDYSVSSIDNNEIDKHNILQSTQTAMHNCLDSLSLEFDKIFIDGNYFKPYKLIEYECVIKGDDKIPGISAASILAKVSRDKYITELCEAHTELEKYNLNKLPSYINNNLDKFKDWID